MDIKSQNMTPFLRYKIPKILEDITILNYFNNRTKNNRKYILACVMQKRKEIAPSNIRNWKV